MTPTALVDRPDRRRAWRGAGQLFGLAMGITAAAALAGAGSACGSGASGEGESELPIADAGIDGGNDVTTDPGPDPIDGIGDRGAGGDDGAEAAGGEVVDGGDDAVLAEGLTSDTTGTDGEGDGEDGGIIGDVQSGDHHGSTPCDGEEDCIELDDGDLCNGVQACVEGYCSFDETSVVQCDKSNDTACSFTVCNPGSGKCMPVVAKDGTSCDDEDICNGIDFCEDGVCVSEDGLDCVDGEGCTQDLCDPVDGCSNPPIPDGESCDSGDVCDGVDTCDGGLCVPGEAPDCSDGDACTDDLCDPVDGCLNPQSADGTPCPDGNACNGDETCKAGICEDGEAPICSDGDLCTKDSCVPASGCVFDPVPDGTDCDDDDPCTSGEACKGGKCIGPQLDCDDEIPCTVDACIGGDCFHVPAFDGQPCGDQTSTCAFNQCMSGECVINSFPDGTLCPDDGEECTVDRCIGGVCQHDALPDEWPCTDDGDACSYDACIGGACSHPSNDPAPVEKGECFPAATLTADTGVVEGDWGQCGVADQFEKECEVGPAGPECTYTGAIDSWGCSNPVFGYGADDWGFEFTYTFVAPVDGVCTLYEYDDVVLVWVPGTGSVWEPIIDWFILSGAGDCAAEACLGYMWEPREDDPECPDHGWCSYRSFQVTEGEVFYIVGDLYQLNVDLDLPSWDIEIRCDSGSAILIDEDFSDSVCSGCTEEVQAGDECNNFGWHPAATFAGILFGYYLGQYDEAGLLGYGGAEAETDCFAASADLGFPAVTLPEESTACTLTFDYYAELDPDDDGDCARDFLEVLLSVDGADPVLAPGSECKDQLPDSNPIGSGSGGVVETKSFDLSDFAGSTVEVTFAWSQDEDKNEGLGVIIDNVRLECELPAGE